MLTSSRSVAGLALACSFLAACGGHSGGGAAPGATDLAGPALRIDFPPGTSLTGAATLHVRGRATDAAGVDAVVVGAVTATLDIATGTFDAVVPLADGDNVFDVVATDARGNPSHLASAVRVRRETPLTSTPSALVVDAGNGRVLVADPLFAGVIAIDLATRRRSVLSEPEQGPALGAPTALAARPAGPVWIAAGTDVQRVDALTGARAAVSGATLGAGPLPTRIDALAWDAAGARLLALDGAAPARVISIDPANGARSVLSGGGAAAGPAFIAPVDLVVDAANGRALVLDAGLDAVVAVELATGARSHFSGAGAGAGPSLLAPLACALAPAAGRLYVADGGAQGLVAVDLATGERVFSPDADLRRPAISADSASLAWDAAHGRLLVSAWNGVLQTDPNVLVAQPFSLDAVGVGRPFTDPGDLAFDELRDQLLVHDRKPEGSRLVRVYVATGSRRTGSGVTPTKYFTAAGAAIDRAHDRLLTLGPATDPAQQRIVSYRLQDGLRGDLGLAPILQSAVGLCVLPGGDLALFSAHELLRYDLVGHSASPLVAAAGGFGTLNGAAVDAEGTRLFVSDLQPGSADQSRILAVRIADGASSVVVSSADWRATKLVHDAATQRILALDELGAGLVAVDPTSGGRAVVTSGGNAFLPFAARRAPSFEAPRGLALDSNRRVAYTTHGAALRGVLATDVTTGERVILSR